MSLSDALLLDPYPYEIWVNLRSDGINGSGTLNDPYDGSKVGSTPFEGKNSGVISLDSGFAA